MVLEQLPKAVEAAKVDERVDDQLVDKVLRVKKRTRVRRRATVGKEAYTSFSLSLCGRNGKRSRPRPGPHLDGNAEEVETANVLYCQADEVFGRAVVVGERRENRVVEIVLRHILQVVLDVATFGLHAEEGGYIN